MGGYKSREAKETSKINLFDLLPWAEIWLEQN